MLRASSAYTTRDQGFLLSWHLACNRQGVVNIAGQFAGSEATMKQESIDYLDKVACIANAHMVYQSQSAIEERDNTERGMALLMSAFLEMYDHWKTVKAGTEAPSNRVYVAADACVSMRDDLLSVARHKWNGEAEGLYQMITAYMFLFKHMYVPQN